jgi:hypothetical protein
MKVEVWACCRVLMSRNSISLTVLLEVFHR